MEIFSQEIVDNIKHEPEVHFELILPAVPEHKLKRHSIKAKRFDQRWKCKANLFDSFWACDDCQYVTKNQKDQITHQRHCGKIFQCDHCLMKFPRKVILMLHMKKHRHKDLNRFSCKSCGQVFKKNAGLTQHLRYKLNKFFKCMLCDEKFVCVLLKQQHEIAIHKVDSGWKCSQCPFIATEKIVTKRHQQAHDLAFSCETCKKRFALRTVMKQHQMLHQHGIFNQTPPAKYECDICGRFKSCKDYLREHMREQHRDQKLQCDICSKTFKQKKTLIGHLEIHNKLQCPICPRKVTKKIFNYHIKAHSEKKNIICKLCPRRVSTNKSLRTHVRFYCPNNPDRINRKVYS